MVSLLSQAVFNVEIADLVLEVRRLPGCDGKISLLFSEFKDSGDLSEIQRAASDQKLTAIKTFTNIFGVSAVTAESFYRRG